MPTPKPKIILVYSGPFFPLFSPKPYICPAPKPLMSEYWKKVRFSVKGGEYGGVGGNCPGKISVIGINYPQPPLHRISL